jgi:hypothetical protein
MRLRSVLILLSAASVLSAADFKEFKKTVPLEPNGRFRLDTYKGSIHITAWDRPEVDIQARIEADMGLFYEPVDNVDIRVDASRGSVSVKTDYHRQGHWMVGWEGNLPNVKYTIQVPRNVSLYVKDYKSDSDVSGVLGEVEFETYKGTARLDGLRGGLQLNTYKGDVRAVFTAFTARTHIDTYRGTVELSLPKASAFELRANLQRHADFKCDFPRTVNSSYHDRRREQDLRSLVNGGGALLHINTYRGSIRLRSIP